MGEVRHGTFASGLDDVGPEVIRRVRKGMNIDAEWSVRNKRGFAWWGHRLRQRVWAGAAQQSNGYDICRLDARTDLARDVVVTPKFVESLAALNRLAGLSAVVLDTAARTVSMACHMVVHRQTLEWVAPLFLSAVATQAAEAEVWKEAMATQSQGRPDESAHPKNGPRPEPDEMLSVIDNVFIPVGRRPNLFPEWELDVIAEINDGPSVMTSASGGELTAEMPFRGKTPAMLMADGGAPQTALCRISVTARHPLYGNGCLMLLQPPTSCDASVVNWMNQAEADGAMTGYGLGAWCLNGKDPVFNTFLPSPLYRRGLVSNLFLGFGPRSSWAHDALDTRDDRTA